MEQSLLDLADDCGSSRLRRKSIERAGEKLDSSSILRLLGFGPKLPKQPNLCDGFLGLDASFTNQILCENLTFPVKIDLVMPSVGSFLIMRA